MQRVNQLSRIECDLSRSAALKELERSYWAAQNTGAPKAPQTASLSKPLKTNFQNCSNVKTQNSKYQNQYWSILVNISKNVRRLRKPKLDSYAFSIFKSWDRSSRKVSQILFANSANSQFEKLVLFFCFAFYLIILETSLQINFLLVPWINEVKIIYLDYWIH